MNSLRTLFEELGMRDAVTYLNSGNVVFRSDLGPADVTSLLSAGLERTTGQSIPILVKSSRDMIAIAESIPAEWSNDDHEQTYVAYLFSTADRPDLVAELPVRREFMSIFYTPGAIVWNIKRKDYNRSQITRIAGHSAYALMTTRNVNTARKLAQMCREFDGTLA